MARNVGKMKTIEKLRAGNNWKWKRVIGEQ